jgi:tight adherence protein B
MNILLLGSVIFIFSLLVLEFAFYAVRIFLYPDREEVRHRLKQSLSEKSERKCRDILKKRVLSDIPLLNRLLNSFTIVEKMQTAINQANLKYTLGFFILLSMALGLTAYLMCLILLRNAVMSVLVSMIFASLPLIYVRLKKRQRVAKFEKQFPEALGLVARALRAGHAFASGMKLASEEFSDPLGPEFDETLDEINFGLSVSDALKNLAQRMDSADVRFFVISVILQRETGGNLAEIIEGLAHLIRERFKFRGKVRTLSAEGRLSAKILIMIPFVLFAVLSIINPNYANTLINEPVGRYILGISGCMLIVGAAVIRWIIRVEV